MKSFEVTDLPGTNLPAIFPTKIVIHLLPNIVRTCKFIARKQWIITGADDMYIRVYNYNTMEKVVTFEAHQDYIR